MTPGSADRKTGTVIFQITPERVDDLVPVAHNFIGMKVSKVGDKRVRQLHPGPANLAGMLDACGSLDTRISLEQAQADAVQAYFHLLSRQNFKAYGGVDPLAVAGKFRDCQPGENPVHDSSYMPIAGGRTAHVRFAVAPDSLSISKEFGQEVLGRVAAKGCKATPAVRLAHAIAQLAKSDLLYRVAVLWNSDPRLSSEAKPIATIAIRGSWLPEGGQTDGSPQLHEFSARKGIDKLLHEWCTLRKSDQYTSSSESIFANSGIYRYVAANADLQRWVLLDQYRVRWWAATDDNEVALGYDNRRTKDYLDVISRLVIRDVENY